MKKCLVILVLALALAMACGIALADDDFIVKTGFLPDTTITINKVNLAGEEVPVQFEGNFDPSYLMAWKDAADLCGSMLELSYSNHTPGDEFFGHTVIVLFHFTHSDPMTSPDYEHQADGTSKYLCPRCLKWVTVPASEVTRAEHYAAGMEWRWDPKATCDNPGESVYACKVCGWVDEEYTAGHVNTIQHDPVLVVVAPTCVETDIGEAYWKCARCGVYLQFDSSFTDLKVVKTKAQAALNTEDDTGTSYALNTINGFSDWYNNSTHNSLKNDYWKKAPGAFDPHKWGSPFETIPASCGLNSYSMRICQLCEKTKVTENARSNLGTKYQLVKVEREGSCFKVKATFSCANCIALGARDNERCSDLEIIFENGKQQSGTIVGNHGGAALKAKSNMHNNPSFPFGAQTMTDAEAVAAVGMKNIDLLQKIQMHEYILSPDYLVKIEEGNCTMGTVKYYKCIFCDDEFAEHTTPGMVDPLDTEMLTDTEDGIDYVKSMLKAVTTGAPKGHDWDGYVYKGKSGVMQLWVRTCKVCGETENWIAETPPPEACAAHTPIVDTTVKATCDADGYTTYKCKVCGIALPELTKVEKAKGHSDKSVLVETTKAATCTEKGIGKYYCPDCNTSYTKELPALGHKWAATPYETKEATKTEDGYKKFKCENEGCKEIKTEVVKYVVTAPAKYELKDVKYEDGIVSGKLVHVEDTLEAPELGIRVTFFNENTYITVSAMLKADGSFVAKGAGAVEHVTVAAYATEDVVTADGLEDKWFGSVSIDVK